MESAVSPHSIAIARIVRTRGNRGEVLAELHTDFPARFNALEEVWLDFADGRRERFRLEERWDYKGRWILKFAGIDSISAAEKLAGAWVRIDAAADVTLPDGTYFDHDLIGCVVMTLKNECLGTVKDVLRIASNNLLVVEGIHGEILIPAKEAICREISIAKKEISVDLPEGLIDINK